VPSHGQIWNNWVTAIPGSGCPNPNSLRPWCSAFPRLPRTRPWEMSMRSHFCIVGLVAASLVASLVPAHSRGFAWFFSHSRPSESCTGQSVVATYYTSGRRTASGQAFDPSGYTAAHRTLPFGSNVAVTNPANGRSVTVVINDRGPFTRGVTLDLSRGAARAIGMSATQWVCIN
jgi:rare lipoprotein A